MQIKQLPSQLVSLVHHIALNETGWWDKTIQRIIIATIWLSEDGQLSTIQITEALKFNFGIRLSSDKIEEQLQKLSSKQTLFIVGKNAYKISEEEHKKFAADLEAYEIIERNSKKIFFDQIDTFCHTVDKESTWLSFNDEMLSPLIHEMGAKTYELISGHDSKVESHIKFQNYIQRFSKDLQINVRNVIVSFLDPKNVTIREFVLRKLNAYFALEAGNLSEHAIQTLTEATKKPLSFEVFVDTNFLFSILGLHESEVNDAADSLLNLMKEISNKIEIKLQVSKPTLKEAQDVLHYHQHVLKNLRLSPNLSGAATATELSGLAKKFVEVCSKSKTAIKAEDYFSPYLNNLLSIIKPKGLNFFNNELSNYPTDQRVIDDVIDRLEYEEKIYGQNKNGNFIPSKSVISKKIKKGSSKIYNKSNYKSAKTYENLLHDIILWYFIKDRRSSMVESPADAKNWIVTEDFRFLSFDRFKRRKKKHEKIPICIHPATLVQILQFWVPRTPEFEEVILSNLRCPFLFHEFDKNSEKITVSILEVLSRYENVNNLPEETVTSILMNDALRNKIGKEKNVEKQIKLISDLIFETNSKINNELTEAHEIISTLKDNNIKLNSEKENYEITNQNLLLRIKVIENERQQEKNYVTTVEEYEQRKIQYVKDEFEILPKYKLNIWLLFLGLLCVPTAFLTLNHYVKLENNILKYIIPSILFLITLLLSFLNRDHCIKSFKYNFIRRKFKKSKEVELLKEFIKSNPKPQITDFEIK